MGDDDKTRDALNSNVVVAFARLAMPIVIAIVGAFGTYILNNLNNGIDEVKTSTRSIYGQIETLKQASAKSNTDLSVLSTDLTNSDHIITDHETRLRVLERVPHN